jgi:hypothetical protein
VQTLEVDFLLKGQDLAFPGVFSSAQSPKQQERDGQAQSSPVPDGKNRRLLHTAVERWAAPRAASVRRLVLS